MGKRLAIPRHTELQRVFEVQKRTTIREGGGRTQTWTKDAIVGENGNVVGVLADASSRDMLIAERFSQSVSHQIIIEGATHLRRGDHRLVLRETGKPTRFFYVESVEDPGALGVHAIYAVNEKGDV